MQPRRALRKQQAGFTLVEAIVGLVIFGVGTLLLVGLAPRATQYANHGKLLAAANGLAQAKLEELRALPVTDAELQSGVHADPDNPLQGAYEREWEVTDDDPIDGMKRVEVRVLFQTAQEDSVASLVTYF